MNYRQYEKDKTYSNNVDMFYKQYNIVKTKITNKSVTVEDLEKLKLSVIELLITLRR